MGPEEKLKELDERMNRLENKLKISLFEIEKMVNMPKQEEPMEDRLLETEDLILLMQLEITKIKEKLGQDIDVELTPKVSHDIEDRVRRIEEEIGGMNSSGIQVEPVNQDDEHADMHERKKEHEIPYRGNVLLDLQKILNK